MTGKIVEIIYPVSVQGCRGKVICPNEDWVTPAWKIFINDKELSKVGKKWIGFNLWTIPTKGLRIVNKELTPHGVE